MKKITSLAIVLALLLCSITTVFAADLDLINQVDDSKNFSWNEFVRVPANLRYVSENIDDYLIEFKGQFYRAAEVNAAIDAGAENFEEAIKGLEPVEKPIEGLEVIEVIAIDNTGVEVVIKALEEDLLGAEIEVLDNNGNKVAVKPVDIAAGDTTFFFEFVTHFADDYEFKGVWKIAGIEIDFDLAAKLDAFVNAAGQIELNKALADLGIENVKVENMPAYEKAKVDFLADLEEDLTVEAIQAWINEVNEEVEKETGEAERKAAAVEAVKEAKDKNNDVLLLAALEEHFDRVNPEWFGIDEGYKAKITDEDFTLDFDDIQKAIDEVNQEAVAEAYDKAFKSLDAKDVEAARELANNYLSDEEEIAKDAGISIREFANDHLDVLDALIDVNEATTPNILKRALVKLDELDTKLVEKYKDVKGYFDKKAFDIETVKDEYLKAYIDAIKKADPKEKNQRSDIQAIIEEVNDKEDKKAEEVNKLIEKTTVEVQNKPHPEATNGACYLLGYTVKFNLGNEEEKTFTFADTKSVVAEFYKGKDLIGKLELKDPVNNTKVKDENSADGTLDVFGDYDSYSWKQEWNGKVTDIPTKVVVKVEYIEKGLAIKEIEIKESDEFDTVPFFVEAVNRAETAEEMSRALINLEAKVVDNEKAFTNLPKADKLIVAQRVLEIRNEQEGIEGIPNTAGKFFSAKNTLDASVLFNTDGVVDGVITARNSILTEVNKAVVENNDTQDGKITAIITALETKIGTTDDDVKPFFPEFVKLTPADKADIAELVLENAPKDKDGKVIGYKTVAEIKAVAGL